MNTEYVKNLQHLQRLMQAQGINTLTELSRRSHVSQRELLRLLYGLTGKMQLETLVKLTQTLNIPLNELLGYFWTKSGDYPILTSPEEGETIKALKRDYQLVF